MFWDETERQVDADLRGVRHAGLPHRLLSSAVDGRVKVGSPLNDPTMSRVGKDADESDTVDVAGSSPQDRLAAVRTHFASSHLELLFDAA